MRSYGLRAQASAKHERTTNSWSYPGTRLRARYTWAIRLRSESSRSTETSRSDIRRTDRNSSCAPRSMTCACPLPMGRHARHPKRALKVASPVFAHIEITRDLAGPVPTFRLTAGDGAVPKITTLVITDASTEEILWWLAPEGFTSVHSFSIGEVDEEAVKSLAAMDDIDPLEDLPPSDLRHQRALAESACASRRDVDSSRNGHLWSGPSRLSPIPSDSGACAGSRAWSRILSCGDGRERCWALLFHEVRSDGMRAWRRRG